jgi:hypothetical protein
MRLLIGLASACVIALSGWYAYSEYVDHQRGIALAEASRIDRFGERCREALNERDPANLPEFDTKEDAKAFYDANEAKSAGCLEYFGKGDVPTWFR